MSQAPTPSSSSSPAENEILSLSSYKLAVESSSNHIIITNPEGQIVFANSAAEKITGYSFAEMQGKTPSLWGKEMPAEFYTQMWHKIKQDKTSFNGEIVNRLKDGQKYSAIIHISPVIDHSGGLIGYIGTEEDISLIKENQLALEKLTTRFKLATKASAIGVWEYDQNDNDFRWDEQMFRLYNMQQSDKNLSLSEWKDKVHPDDVVRVSHELDLAVSRKGKFDTAFRICTNDAEERYIRAIGDLEKVEYSDNYTLVGVSWDVTKERNVDRMKTEFISLASHQLRTPLAAMKWFSEMLLHGDLGTLTPEQAEYVQHISDSNERMISLVGALLNISRIESGRIIIDPQPTDLKSLVEKVTQVIAPKLEQKNQRLQLSVDETLPQIMLDQKLIHEVFTNLLTNSIKYSSDGTTITLHITTQERDVLVQVTDEGFGIPIEERERVFTKFYRGENIVKRETDGTGLGLYLVQSIIKSSGGRIWFESSTQENGQNQQPMGTTFWFTLPIAGVPAKSGEISLEPTA